MGTVTSGNYSPMLGHGIALALLDSTVEAGTDGDTSARPALGIEQRDRFLPAQVVKTPFVRAGQWASGR